MVRLLLSVRLGNEGSGEGELESRIVSVLVCQAKSQALLTLCSPILFMSILNTTLFLKFLFIKCSSSFDARKWGHAAAQDGFIPVYGEQPRNRSDDN